MPAAPTELLDLKLLPAWVKESSAGTDYSHFEGETDTQARKSNRPHRRAAGSERRRDREPKRRETNYRGPGHGKQNRDPRPLPPPPVVTVRFLPRSASLDHVIAQVKATPIAYSLFALARLFLEKPEHYEVELIAAQQTRLYQLGEHGPVACDRHLLESTAFSLAKEDFYKIEIVQSEPIKGSFSNVARCRASGTLLGPTNHHSYQAQLRSLYEQRFSRRMSFTDYQRQIEVVSDPTAVEQWKEQARNITTYTTTRIEPAVTFNTTAEAERNFRQNHLPNLIRNGEEFTVGGVLSRHLPDHALSRLIENAWAREFHSPSQMMQQLAKSLREAGLHIFRHRRGMLFVSSIRSRSFKHEPASVTSSIAGILEAVGASPGIHRKELAGRLIPTDAENADHTKMTLAADLKWLISEGYVIEFNGGALDLPRTKIKETEPAANIPIVNEAPTAAEPPAPLEIGSS
jgi:hypothetical protein